MPHNDNRYNQLFDALKEQGWNVSHTARGHYRAKSPVSGVDLVHFSVSSSYRAMTHTVAQLRRSGFVWPPEEYNKVKELKTMDIPKEVVERVRAAAVKPAPPPPASGPQLTPLVPVDTQDPDAAYSTLKVSREFCSLAIDELTRKRDALVEAQRAVETAEAEAREWQTRLVEAKRAFDQLFELDLPKAG